VTALVAKSLISADFGEAEPRLRLLETTRAYAMWQCGYAGAAACGNPLLGARPITASSHFRADYLTRSRWSGCRHFAGLRKWTAANQLVLGPLPDGYGL
jgi:hypothetical protein